MNKKLITAASIALAACVAIGGTIAYLTDKTDTITNTFTVGKVAIDLDETTGQSYKMIPGTTLDKDPTVTVKADSEDSWVFVKVDETDNLDTYIEYATADGWEALEGFEGVFYRYVKAADVDQSFNVLANNKVVVKDSVTTDDMNAAETNAPKLTFTAYAIQAKNGNETYFTAENAWAQLDVQ